MDSEFQVEIGAHFTASAPHSTSDSPKKPLSNLFAPSSLSSPSSKLTISELSTNGTQTPQRSLRNSLFTSAEAAGAQLRTSHLSFPSVPSHHIPSLASLEKSHLASTVDLNDAPVASLTTNRAPKLRQAIIMTKSEKLQLKGDASDLELVFSHEMTMGLKPSNGMRFSLPSTKRHKLADDDEDSGVVLFGSRLSHVPSVILSGPHDDSIDDPSIEPTLDPNNASVHFDDDIQGLIDRHKQAIAKSQPSQSTKNCSSSDNMDGDAVEVEDLVLSEPGKLPIVRVPGVVNAKLFSYQRDGIRFLLNLYVENRGGILADDMGLGKTVQTICFIMAIKSAQPAATSAFFPSQSLDSRFYAKEADLETSAKIYAPTANSPVLVVCPASLLQHWHREFYHWTKLRTFIAHGKHDKLKALDDAKANRLDVVLISYETLATSVKHLNETTFSCVVFDEAHRVKNLKTKVYTACAALKVRRKYGLTGTVMQNSFEELWALCHVLGFATSALGDLDYFKKHYISPIKEGHVQDASNAQISRASIVASSLVEKLSRFILRRTKQCISHQLPPKEDHIVFCAPTELQLKIYKRITDSPLYRLLRQNSIPCTCGSGIAASRCCSKRPKALEMSSKIDMPKVALPALTRLQQLANHVSLIVPPELIQDLQNLALLKRRTSASFQSGVTSSSSSTATTIPSLTSKSSVQSSATAKSPSFSDQLSNESPAVIPPHPQPQKTSPSSSRNASFGIDHGTQSHLITNFFNPSSSTVPNPDEDAPPLHRAGGSLSNSKKTTSSSSTTPPKSLRPSFLTIAHSGTSGGSISTGGSSSTSGSSSSSPSSSTSPSEKTLSSLITSPFLKLAFGEDLDHIVECLANGDDDLELCGKLKVLSSLLPHWRSQDAKVLLFSSSTRLMDVLARFCTKQGYSFGRLEGTTPIHQRQRLVDQFNKTKSQFIFIVSTKACGVGLNLSSANVVVIFEPHFNVSLDMQASDRAHRIGQVRTTRVYRLVSAFTIEELTYRRQIYKQQMANIATEGRNEKRFFKMSEVFGAHLLFSLLDRSQLNTVDILERGNTFPPPTTITASATSHRDLKNSDGEDERNSNTTGHRMDDQRRANESSSSPLSDVNMRSEGQYLVTRDGTSDSALAKSDHQQPQQQQHNSLFQLIFSKAQQQQDDVIGALVDDGALEKRDPTTSSLVDHHQQQHQYASSVPGGEHLSEVKGVVGGVLDQSELDDMDDILRKAGALHSHLNSELFSTNAQQQPQTSSLSSSSLNEDIPIPTTSSSAAITTTMATGSSSVHHVVPKQHLASMMTLEPLMGSMGQFRSANSMAEDMEHLSPAFLGDAACRKFSSTTAPEEEFPELM